MKKVGLYFGSYNPVHLGHLHIAEFILNQNTLDEIWFVVSPQNPFKEKTELAEPNHRLAMLEIVVKNNPQLKASDIEFHLPTPSYTVNTLKNLKELHPEVAFELIIGEDNLLSFHKWKNYQYILENFHCNVYPRISEKENNIASLDILKDYPASFTIIDAPLKNISATEIRNNITEGSNLEKYLSKDVINYIELYHLYNK